MDDWQKKMTEDLLEFSRRHYQPDSPSDAADRKIAELEEEIILLRRQAVEDHERLKRQASRIMELVKMLGAKPTLDIPFTKLLRLVHPDRHPGQEKLATEMTQWLLSQRRGQ